MLMYVIAKGRKSAFILLLALITTMGIFSCGNDDDEVIEEPGFDRAAMLESIANNLIIPNFEALQSSVDALSAAANTFAQTPSVENLTALRTAWVQAVTDHQHCSAFGFGPAKLLLGPYAEVLGAFPVSEDKIEQNILDSNIDLANSFDRDIRGFYTVEYLIYGSGSSIDELIAGFDQNRNRLSITHYK